MQAIARVNRVFRDKPGGLVVDYLGLAAGTQGGLGDLYASGGKGQTAIDQDEAVAGHAREVRNLLRTVPRLRLVEVGRRHAGQSGSRCLPAAQEHILAQEEGKPRLLKAVTELSQAFALAVPHDEALRIRDDVAFFQAVRAVLARPRPSGRVPRGDRIWPSGRSFRRPWLQTSVVDIFAAAGLKKPDISILSDEFLADVQGMPQRNLAVELLRKLLDGEIRSRSAEESWSKRDRLRKCWNRRSVATRTVRSRPPRSSRN